MRVLGGISDRERLHLARLDSESRVNALFAQVLGMVNGRRAAGGVHVDAPVLSRFHQEMSTGMYGFQQACKLEDTPFPFPVHCPDSILVTCVTVHSLISLTQTSPVDTRVHTQYAQACSAVCWATCIAPVPKTDSNAIG